MQAQIFTRNYILPSKRRLVYPSCFYPLGSFFIDYQTAAGGREGGGLHGGEAAQHKNKRGGKEEEEAFAGEARYTWWWYVRSAGIQKTAYLVSARKGQGITPAPPTPTPPPSKAKQSKAKRTYYNSGFLYQLLLCRRLLLPLREA